jgi:iron complex outermembrane receptor protein
MKHSRNPLYQAVRYALVPGAMASFALSSSAVFAQDSEEEAADLDRVQVTGSRISRIDIEGANPVTVLDREDIKRTGITDLGELVQDLPMMSGSPVSTQRNNGGNGSVAVDIRGMGTNRTLVLVNGRRAPSLFNDLSTIPVAMIERIEILKDGASAIYGADAVAGVVNLITRKDFEGAEYEFTIGESFDQGGQNWQTSFITGGNTDRGNFVIGIEYTEQDGVLGSAYDEAYIAQATAIYDADEFHQYGFSQGPGADMDGDEIPGWWSFGSSRREAGYFNVPGFGNNLTVCDGETGDSVDDYGPGGVCGPATYNYQPVNYMQTPYERSSFFFQGDYELYDNITAYAEARFANRASSQLLAPNPYDSRFDPGFQIGTNADGTPLIGIPAENYYNPFGQDVTLFLRRMTETGGRLYEQNVDQWQIVTGVTGDIGTTWTWDLSYNYGKSERADTDYGQFNGNRLAAAVGPSFLDPATGLVTCGTPSDPIAGCVPMNFFSRPDTNPITQEMLDYVSIPLNDRFVNERQVTNFTVVGDVFELPAGTVGIAAGYERRKENYQYIPDSSKTTNATTGNTGTGTDGAYNIDSFFGEVNIPILSGMVFAENLELGLGARYDDFSIYDASSTMQASLRWQPVRSLLLRGTWGEVYREPNISELFAGVGDSFPNITDPCSEFDGNNPSDVANLPGCVGQVPPGYVQEDAQARARVGGNINVTPEEGETWTVGMAWSPTFASGLSMTLDYWNIDIEDSINIPSATVVLSGCASGAIPGFCSGIKRFPGPAEEGGGAPNEILALVQKVGPESATGVDWSVNYNWNTDIGLWGFAWMGTYNLERKLLTVKDFDGDGLETAEVSDVVGLYEHRGLGGAAAYNEYRWRFDTDWSLGDFGASLSIEYLDGVTECGDQYGIVVCPDSAAGLDGSASALWVNTIDDVYYFDLVGRYTAPFGTQFAVGVTNLTDEALPYLSQGFNFTTEPDTYRAFGRSWFFNIKHTF